MSRILKLSLIVTISGFVVMTLEIVGARLLAPYLGSSVFIWTSIIGVILASLSIGYWKGGELADKNPNFLTFSRILLYGGLAIGVTIVLHIFVLPIFSAIDMDLRLSALLSSVLLFALPSVILGMVLPYATRLAITNVESSGKTVGRLYAFSAVGSILGTFTSGFILFSFLGSIASLVILAVVMVLLSLFAHTKSIARSTEIAALFFVAAAAGSVLYGIHTIDDAVLRTDTSYQPVVIEDKLIAGEAVRTLRTTAGGTQSALFISNPTELLFDYTQAFYEAASLHEEPERILLVGGGAFTFPRSFLEGYPDARIDVVEIDPELTDITKKYFFRESDPRMTIIHRDGRVFLNNAEGESYDIIYEDAYNGAAPPFQLMTKEAVEHRYRLLRNGGFVVQNIIGSLEGQRAEFVRNIYATYSAVFPTVTLLKITNEPDGRIQNMILLAYKDGRNTNRQDELTKDVGHTVSIEPGKIVYTDNFAPVEKDAYGL